jgi:hypothetical protein
LRIVLEAGEAADEEAVAEKAQMKRAAAQIKRTARGDLTAEEAMARVWRRVAPMTARQSSARPLLAAWKRSRKWLATRCRPRGHVPGHAI